MSFDKENPEMLSLLRAFEHRGVQYLIVGEFAVNRYGYSRATGDLDIYLKDSSKVRFLHYNHLIENKKATGRPKDQIDIQELNRINNQDSNSK